MASTAFCLPAVHHVLQLANPEGRPWRFSNEVQRELFAKYGDAGGDVAGLDEWLEGKVTDDADELQAWLAERGWPDVVVPIPEDGVAIASVFDLLVEWERPGRRRPIHVPVNGGKRGKSSSYAAYDGVEMEASACLCGYRIAGHRTPMFELETRTDEWKVFLIEVASGCSLLGLPAAAMDLLSRERAPFEFDELRFPTVEMRADVDVSWLTGMEVEHLCRIEEAKKKISLRLDQRGAHARSAAAAATVVLGGPPAVYQITTPFLVIFWRPGLRAPAFVALSDIDSWLPLEAGS